MIEAVIFDLDGVIVSTDEFHYLAWKKLADRLGIEFDREINERLRGVSRRESLMIVLEKSEVEYSEEDILGFLDEKNATYLELLQQLSPADILEGVEEKLEWFEANNIHMAIGSSSRNTPVILEKIGLSTRFEAIADGNQIKNSKPDPEVFLLAAKLLGIAPEKCLVVEDAAAGVEAAIAANMAVLGVGSASEDARADYRSSSMKDFDPSVLL